MSHPGVGFFPNAEDHIFPIFKNPPPFWHHFAAVLRFLFEGAFRGALSGKLVIWQSSTPNKNTRQNGTVSKFRSLLLIATQISGNAKKKNHWSLVDHAVLGKRRHCLIGFPYITWTTGRKRSVGWEWWIFRHRPGACFKKWFRFQISGMVDFNPMGR